jgi:hypothetical protein
MEHSNAQLAPLVRALARPVAVLLVALSLSACVTLPNASGSGAASGSGDAVQTAITSGVSALSDFFSPDVREAKKLITEGKLAEAQAFVTIKEAFFAERYKTSGSAPAEFVTLAEHVLANEWRPKLLVASTGMSTSLNFDDAAARANATAAWKAADEAQAAVESALLYKITSVGREELASLVKSRESLKGRAEAFKPDVAAGMLDRILASTDSRYEYVGPLKLEEADLVASPGFQAAALARLNAAPDRRELERLAGRLEPFLSSEGKAGIDTRFVELVRKEYLADGRISLEELGILANMSTPISRSKGPLLGMVKVGLAETVRKNGTREFSVNAAKDLAFDLEDAADALLTRRDGSAYDFMYVVSLQDARVERETGSPRQESSRYRAGTDREANPAYEQARQRLSRAQSNFSQVRAKASQAQADAARCPPSRAQACGLALIAVGFGVGSAEQEVKEAREALNKTPATLEKPRIASYQYRVIPQTVKKEVSGMALLWDVKGKQAWVMPAEHKAQRSFQMAQGVHEADENRASILNRADKPQDADRFAREGVELPLSALFSAGRLSSVRKESAMDANAVLRLLSEAYERNAPQDDPPSVGRVFRLPG